MNRNSGYYLIVTRLFYHLFSYLVQVVDMGQANVLHVQRRCTCKCVVRHRLSGNCCCFVRSRHAVELTKLQFGLGKLLLSGTRDGRYCFCHLAGLRRQELLNNSIFTKLSYFTAVFYVLLRSFLFFKSIQRDPKDSDHEGSSCKTNSLL